MRWQLINLLAEEVIDCYNVQRKHLQPFEHRERAKQTLQTANAQSLTTAAAQRMGVWCVRRIIILCETKYKKLGHTQNRLLPFLGI